MFHAYAHRADRSAINPSLLLFLVCVWARAFPVGAAATTTTTTTTTTTPMHKRVTEFRRNMIDRAKLGQRPPTPFARAAPYIACSVEIFVVVNMREHAALYRPAAKNSRTCTLHRRQIFNSWGHFTATPNVTFRFLISGFCFSIFFL